MPELPEVETIRSGLSRLLPGKQITRVSYDWSKSFPNAPADVDRFLIGAKVAQVSRRAKVLLIELDSKYSLVIHLKMTGQLVFVGKQQKQVTSNKEQVTRWGGGHPNDDLLANLPNKSTRVDFEFSDGAHLFFNDQRKFGWVRLIPTIEVPNIDFMKKLGPEPLDPGLSNKEFIQRIRKRANTSVKAALLDQTVVAGIGNIYADESLFGAKIHPACKVNTISDQQLNILLAQARKVLKLSIKMGGSTDKNYVDALGLKGSYLKFALVFRREGKPCPRCQTVIIKIRVAERGTHLCPSCQKESI